MHMQRIDAFPRKPTTDSPECAHMASMRDARTATTYFGVPSQVHRGPSAGMSEPEVVEEQQEQQAPAYEAEPVVVDEGDTAPAVQEEEQDREQQHYVSHAPVRARQQRSRPAPGCFETLVSFVVRALAWQCANIRNVATRGGPWGVWSSVGGCTPPAGPEPMRWRLPCAEAVALRAASCSKR
jgi:hypothetical protein